MKRSLGLIDKIIYALNLVAAVLLMLSFITPYIPPQKFALLSALSLLVSPLLLINLLFVCYWLFRLKKRIWISGVLLIIAYFHFNPFLRWGKGEDLSASKELKVLTYNVHLFEAYEEEPTPDIENKLADFLDSEKPDLFLMQEYYPAEYEVLDIYPHRFVHFHKSKQLGHAIYSKYPLLNTGAFNFESTTNNSIYADVVVGSDTLRLYNIHLQSFNILPSVSLLQDGPSEQIKNRITTAFKMQEDQISQILEHSATSKYPVILAGDLNNTAFSYVYRKVAQNYQDAFDEQGSGLGTTLTFDFYPIRIDYIFADESFKVTDFKTLERPFSDHNPVISTLGWD